MAQTAHQSCKAEISSCTKKKYLRYQNSNFWKLNEAPCIIFKNTWSRRVDARSATFCYRKLHIIFCFKKMKKKTDEMLLTLTLTEALNEVELHIYQISLTKGIIQQPG